MPAVAPEFTRVKVGARGVELAGHAGISAAPEGR
jgi:hypothetical protein